MGVTHYWSPEWQTTYCGESWGARITTTFAFSTCSDCYSNYLLAGEISRSEPDDFCEKLEP